MEDCGRGESRGGDTLPPQIKYDHASHATVPRRVAVLLTGISPAVLTSMVTSGAVKQVKIKGELYIDLDSLEDALQSRLGGRMSWAK